jgi:hypothetical protein
MGTSFENSGVYFLEDSKENILYIGQSKNIFKRIITHLGKNSNLRQNSLFKNIEKIKVLFMEEDLLLTKESEFILAYNPPLNGDVGRPKGNEPLRKASNFSATDDEIEEIDRLAELNNMNRSEFIRWKTLGK